MTAVEPAQTADDLERALRRFQLMQATALADLGKRLSTDPLITRQFEAVSQLATAYHGFFMSLPTRLRPPMFPFLRNAQEDPQEGATQPLRQEAERIRAAYIERLRSPIGEAMVEFAFGYYAVAQLDGFRALIWLARTISSMDAVRTVPSYLQSLQEKMWQAVGVASGHAVSDAPLVEPYSCLQIVNDRLATYGYGNPLHSLDDLQLRLPDDLCF